MKVSNSCIIWPYSSRVRNGYEYPKINVRLDGASLSLNPYRVSLIMSCGYHDDEEFNIACHDPVHCTTSLCINPRHLRWGTHSENMADKILSGTSGKGSKNGWAKLTEDDVRNILSDSRSGVEMSKIYGVNPSAISKIRTGKRWGHIKV